MFILVEQGAVKDIEGKLVSPIENLKVQSLQSIVTFANDAGLTISEDQFTIIDVLQFVRHGAIDVTGDGKFTIFDIRLLLDLIDSAFNNH